MALDGQRPVVIRPDVTILLRVEPEIAMARLASRKGLEKFERAGCLRLVGERTTALRRRTPRIVLVDAGPAHGEGRSDLRRGPEEDISSGVGGWPMHPSEALRSSKGNELDGQRIVLGITGSIAAVESFELVRRADPPRRGRPRAMARRRPSW